jgi:hypothetical protein
MIKIHPTPYEFPIYINPAHVMYLYAQTGESPRGGKTHILAIAFIGGSGGAQQVYYFNSPSERDLALAAITRGMATHAGESK